jgi:hypothetical protein
VAVTLSVLALAALCHSGRILVLISVSGCIRPTAIVPLEGLRKMKKIKSSEQISL